MIKGSPEGYFFEYNNAFRYITEVAELIAEYGEKTAGQYMWAIWLVHHPASEIFDMSMPDKIEWIRANYLNDPDFEWPIEQRLAPVEEKPKKKKKKGVDEDDDLMDLEDRLFNDTGVHQVFLNVIKVFPKIAMSVEERMYYNMVVLLDESIEDARWLNGKDKAAAVGQIARSSSELDKVKSKYLTWQESQVKSSGDVQSGWASKFKKK